MATVPHKMVGFEVLYYRGSTVPSSLRLQVTIGQNFPITQPKQPLATVWDLAHMNLASVRLKVRHMHRKPQAD